MTHLSYSEWPHLEEMLINVPKPSFLYHYTDPAGLIGISSSYSLWGARAADLNDRTEQLLVYEYFDELLEGLNYRLDFSQANAKGVLAELQALERMSTLIRSDPSVLPPIHTVSLTTERDSLEQWRAYCPRSGGVSLGFPANRLEELAASQGFVLARCAYGNEAMDLFDRLLVHCTRKVHGPNTRIRELPAEILEARAEQFAGEVFLHLALIAPLFKHPSFESEHEWRLVSNPVNGEHLIPIGTTTGLKLFYPFALSHAGANVDSVVCTIGPNLDPAGMISAVRSFLERRFPTVEIFATETPYR